MVKCSKQRAKCGFLQICIFFKLTKCVNSIVVWDLKKKKMKKMSTVWDLSGFQMGNSLAKEIPQLQIVFLFKWNSLFHLAVISHIFAVPPSDGAEDARPSQLT